MKCITYCFAESQEDIKFFRSFIIQNSDLNLKYWLIVNKAELIDFGDGSYFDHQFLYSIDGKRNSYGAYGIITRFDEHLASHSDNRVLVGLFRSVSSPEAGNLIAGCIAKTIPYVLLVPDVPGLIDRNHLNMAASIVVDNILAGLELSYRLGSETLLPQIAIGSYPHTILPSPGAEPGVVIDSSCSPELTGVLNAELGKLYRVTLEDNREIAPEKLAQANVFVTASSGRALKAALLGWRVVLVSRYAEGLGMAALPEIVFGGGHIETVTAVRKLATSRSKKAVKISPSRKKMCYAAVSVYQVLRQIMIERWTRFSRRNSLPLPPVFLPPVAATRIFTEKESLHYRNVDHRRAVVDIGSYEILNPERVVVFCHDWSNLTGLAQPVKRYLGCMTAAGYQSIVIEVPQTASLESIVKLIRPTDFVIMNSLGIFARSELFYMLASILPLNQMAIYFHETEYTFDKFEANTPFYYEHYKHIAPSIMHFCTSHKQEVFLRQRFGLNHTAVVLNAGRLFNGLKKAEPEDFKTKRGGFDDGVRNILMTGTVQRRKGAELFSRVAEMAHEMRLPWKFSWAGHRLPEAETLQLSDRVNWLGKLEGKAVEDAVADTDLFFLSSIDDPMPMAALEAIDGYKRVVCYTATGTEEVIRNLGGCVVFDEYTPEEALKAIRQAFETPLDVPGYDRVIQELISETSFVHRMTRAINATFARSIRAPELVDEG